MKLEAPFQLQLTQPPSLIGKCLTHARLLRSRKVEQFLVPIIGERNQVPLEERPSDMLTWLMEDVINIGEGKNPRNLTQRVLVANLVAIHTISIMSYPHLTLYPARIQHSRAVLHICHVSITSSVSHALKTIMVYASPEYIHSLREEVE